MNKVGFVFFKQPANALCPLMVALGLLACTSTLGSTDLYSWGGGQTNPAVSQGVLTSLSAGFDHVLAVTADGRVVAWGYNFDGQCNIPLGLSNVVAVAAGAFFSVALSKDGTVTVWGDNQFNQAQVPADLTNAIAISAGRGHVLALRSDGTVTAWGSDAYGQTGVPPGLVGVQSIFAGWNYSLALLTGGSVVAWGVNDAGQTQVPSTLPPLASLSGSKEFCLGVTTTGEVVSWGSAPAVPQGLSGAFAVAAGEDHCVALMKNGTVVSWGANDSGQGNVPANLSNVSSIGAGWKYSLALSSKVGSIPAAPVTIKGFAWNQGIFRVDVLTRSNHSYNLLYSENVTSSNWTALPQTAGNGQTVTLTDSAPGQSFRVYRVQEH